MSKLWLLYRFLSNLHCSMMKFRVDLICDGLTVGMSLKMKNASEAHFEDFSFLLQLSLNISKRAENIVFFHFPCACNFNFLRLDPSGMCF